MLAEMLQRLSLVLEFADGDLFTLVATVLPF